MSGDVDRVFSAVYSELRRLAHRRLAAERNNHTLETTALVHEVYLKLSSQHGAKYQNREQFFSLAAMAMRRILVDYARRHRALKRPQASDQISLSELGVTGSPLASFAATEAAERTAFLIAIDEALDELRTLKSRAAEVVELRFFIGLTEPEIAKWLGVTVRTVARDWDFARGWLYQRLRETTEGRSG